jgi:penicillin-binding protein-related factor A (putative recombinase)
MIFPFEYEHYEGCYTESLDRPYLENKMFIMVKVKTDRQNFQIEEDLMKDPLFYYRYKITHGGIVSFVYVLFREKNLLELYQFQDLRKFGKINKTLPLDESIPFDPTQGITIQKQQSPEP